jgi:hypothetical protein
MTVATKNKVFNRLWLLNTLRFLSNSTAAGLAPIIVQEIFEMKH